LKLANGREWCFKADRNSEWLCEYLAGLAELDAASQNPCETIALVTGDSEPLFADVLKKAQKLSDRIRLPREGWVKNNHKMPKVWSQPGVPFAIASTLSRRDRIMDVLQAQQALYPVITGEIAAAGLPVHAALVEREGEGMLIAAKGGTGKSTCCRRIPPPWHCLSDDEGLIVKTGKKDYRVHPFPTWSAHMWEPSDRSWHVQRHVHLAAIFFLEQADIDACAPYPQSMAAISLYISSVDAFRKYEMNMDAAQVAKFRAIMMDNACQIAITTPAYALKATRSGRFWDAMEQVLSPMDKRPF